MLWHHDGRPLAGWRDRELVEGHGHGGSLQRACGQPLFSRDHVHLVAVIPNGLTVDYMPWSFRLFDEVPVPVNGEMAIPSKPGLGLAFGGDAINRYAVGA